MYVYSQNFFFVIVVNIYVLLQSMQQIFKIMQNMQFTKWKHINLHTHMIKYTYKAVFISFQHTHTYISNCFSYNRIFLFIKLSMKEYEFSFPVN